MFCVLLGCATDFGAVIAMHGVGFQTCEWSSHWAHERVRADGPDVWFPSFPSHGHLCDGRQQRRLSRQSYRSAKKKLKCRSPRGGNPERKKTDTAGDADQTRRGARRIRRSGGGGKRRGQWRACVLSRATLRHSVTCWTVLTHDSDSSRRYSSSARRTPK